MNALPFLQQLVTALDHLGHHLGHQAPHIRPFDADIAYNFGYAARSKQIDLRPSSPGDGDMSRLVIEHGDDKPDAAGTVDDNRSRI